MEFPPRKRRRLDPTSTTDSFRSPTLLSHESGGAGRLSHPATSARALPVVEFQLGGKSVQYTLSRLEALPVELIQNIFFHCLEINLPRTSPVLANALSDTGLYKALLRTALPSFSTRRRIDQPEFARLRRLNEEYVACQYPGNEISSHIFDALLYRRPRSRPIRDVYIALLNYHDARVSFAKRLMRCRWATQDLIRDCRATFLDFIVRKACADGTSDLSDEMREQLQETKDILRRRWEVEADEVMPIRIWTSSPLPLCSNSSDMVLSFPQQAPGFNSIHVSPEPAIYIGVSHFLNIPYNLHKLPCLNYATCPCYWDMLLLPLIQEERRRSQCQKRFNSAEWQKTGAFNPSTEINRSGQHDSHMRTPSERYYIALERFISHSGGSAFEHTDNCPHADPGLIDDMIIRHDIRGLYRLSQFGDRQGNPYFEIKARHRRLAARSGDRCVVILICKNIFQSLPIRDDDLYRLAMHPSNRRDMFYSWLARVMTGDRQNCERLDLNYRWWYWAFCPPFRRMFPQYRW